MSNSPIAGQIDALIQRMADFHTETASNGVETICIKNAREIAEEIAALYVCQQSSIQTDFESAYETTLALDWYGEREKEMMKIAWDASAEAHNRLFAGHVYVTNEEYIRLTESARQQPQVSVEAISLVNELMGELDYDATNWRRILADDFKAKWQALTHQGGAGNSRNKILLEVVQAIRSLAHNNFCTTLQTADEAAYDRGVQDCLSAVNKLFSAEGK